MTWPLLFALMLAPLLLARGAAIPDEPFWQDVSVQIHNKGPLTETNTTFRKLCIDKEGVVYVLTSKGLARVFDEDLALDQSFRPLAGKRPIDIALGSGGDLYYLFEDRWLSNGRNGRPLGHLAQLPSEFRPAAEFTVGADGVFILGRTEEHSSAIAAATESGQSLLPSPGLDGAPHRPRLFSLDGDCFVLAGRKAARWENGKWRIYDLGAEAATLARRGSTLYAGTDDGYLAIDLNSEQTVVPLQKRLPWTPIAHIIPATNGLWFGTDHGVFFKRDGATPAPEKNGTLRDGSILTADHGIRYYASRRWLADDRVVDLSIDKQGSVWVLTPAGLSKIEFHRMTLAEKADWYHKKIRDRHIRFGFTGERRIFTPGDIADSEIIDTDNDGGWTSYYIGSLAARYAAAGEEEIRRDAWESFGALERTQEINPIPGFPARTFERRGYKFSDPDRWREAAGDDWDWKGHTSSDEVCSQTFAHAAMWELVARTPEEKRRIANNYVRIVDHILAHNLYLIDVDGKPTLWGRWNPEYVNWYPPTIGDRRLNSAELTASLELAYKMTGDEKYKRKAYEMFEKHGYLTNILSSMRLVAKTSGYIHEGNDMGDTWNHSDDELGFFTYWVLVRFAFDAELKNKFLGIVADHWQFEREKRFPPWNLIYAACGAKHPDAEGAVWTLRGIPLDSRTWTIRNSHRKDITKRPPNFMERELDELLPPGERLMARLNTQPFILDQGDDAHTELPGDEYLLGYWLGRWLGLIDHTKNE